MEQRHVWDFAYVREHVIQERRLAREAGQPVLGAFTAGAGSPARTALVTPLK